MSPAKSATDGTEVRIETSMDALLRKMELHIKDVVAKEFTVVHGRHQEQLLELRTDMGHLHRAYAIRNIEDWAVKTMKIKLGMKADQEISHCTVVEQFVADFRFRGVIISDLKSLGNSDER